MLHRSSKSNPQVEDSVPTTFHGTLTQFEYQTQDAENLGSSRKPSTPITRSKPGAAHSSRASPLPKLRSRTSTPRSTSASASPSRVVKKRKASSKYAAPSKYAHLPELRDVLEPDLIAVFIGANPGISTSTSGHAYAHPSNLFWKLLHSSGCTPDRRVPPEEDGSLPHLYSLGNTNIVARPTNNTAELSKAEMAAGTAILEEKMLKYKPEAVCIVGKGIWESIWRHRYGKNPTAQEFSYGWQDEKENMGKSNDEELDGRDGIWKGAKVFVATSTSGLAASLRPAQKEAIWRPFGDWVQQRRAERAQTQATQK